MIENEQVYKAYTADGSQRQWEFPYQYAEGDEIALYIEHNGTLTSISSALYDFNTVTNKVTYPLGPGDTAVPAGDTVLLWRETQVTQEEDSSVANFKSNDIERMVDKLTMICQELSDKYSRTIHFNPTDEYDTDATTYVKTVNDAKDIAVEKAGEASISATNAAASETKAQKWAEGSDDDVAALGGTKSSKGWAAISQEAAESDAVQTVYANMSSITDVAGIKDDVTNVASIKNAVVAVNANESKINTVYDNLANVNTVASNIGNVNTVASISGNVTTVAGVSSAVSTVATNATSVAAVATNIANVNAVAANETNINAVNSNKTNIDAVAGNNTNITAVANNATNINAVNANKTNIDTVAGIDQAVTTVATNVQDINDVADALTNIGAIADDLTNIDAVAADLENIDTAVANLPDLADKQNKTLTTPITVDGVSQTTVEAALGAINTYADGKQPIFTVINGGDSTNA